MKFYYFAMIAFGIMILFTVAGIDGIGTNVKNLIVQNDSIVRPDSQYNYSATDTTTVGDDLKSLQTSLWKKILIALLAFGVLGAITGIQLAGFGGSFDAGRAIRSFLGYGLFALFASDMWTIVSLVFTSDRGWIAWFLATIVLIFTAGFGISAIEFAGGTD